MLFVFFLLFTVIVAFENENCDEIIRLKKREVMQLFSPNHPNKVPPRSTCRWTVVAETDRRIVLVCPFYHVMDIHEPEYEETCNGPFTVSSEGREEAHHCQERGFSEIGFKERMVITYENKLYETVDDFTCYVYGELKNRWDRLENYSGNRRSTSFQRRLPTPKEWQLDSSGIELTLNLGKNDMKALVPPSHPEDDKGWWARSWYIRAENSSQITVACSYTDKPPEPLTIQVVPCNGQFTVLTKKRNATYHCNERAFTHYAYSYKPNVSMIVKYENLERQSADNFVCHVYSEGGMSSAIETKSPYKNCDHVFDLSGLDVGVIKSPNYPHETLPGSQCRWTVVTPEHSKVLIKCSEPRVLGVNHCLGDLSLRTTGNKARFSCFDAKVFQLSPDNWTVITYKNSYGYSTAPFRCQANVAQNDPLLHDTGLVNGTFENPSCDHLISLQPRLLRELKYPVEANESEHLACRWIVVSPSEFRIVFVCLVPHEESSELLTCNTMIKISTEDRNDTIHCIDRTFSRTSANNRMVIFYPEGYHHPSKFHTCHLYAEEKSPGDEVPNLTLHYALPNDKCDDSISLSTIDEKDLLSPNYPNDEPPGTACRWVVTAPVQSRIILSCFLILSKGKTCTAYMTVSSEGQLNTTYCMNESFQRTSVTGWMTIIYENVSPEPTQSFNCTLYSELESPSNECENCSVTRVLPFPSCDKLIKLKYYDVKELKLTGKKDKPKTSCRWDVVAPENTRILLSCPYNNETEATSCNSQFTVTTPGSETRFCRNKNFAKYSISYWMIVTYKNPSTDTYSPIKCYVYTEKKLPPNRCGPECSALEAIDYSRCDNTIYLSDTGKTEELKTPDYPEEVHSGVPCRWRVHSPNFTVVALRCPGDELKLNESCKDYLTVYRAGPHDDPVVYCRGASFNTSSLSDEMIITYGNQYGLSQKPLRCFVTPVLEKCQLNWQFPHLPYNKYYHIYTPYWESAVPPWPSCYWNILSPVDTQIYLVCNYLPATEKGTFLTISPIGDEEFTDPSVRSLETSFTEISVSNKMTILYNMTEATRPLNKIGCWLFVDKSPPLGEECNCGSKFNKIIGNRPSNTSRIFGGKETVPNEFPMMAALCNDLSVFCGAVIISDRFALTAAHCLIAAKDRNYNIGLLVGAHQLDRGVAASGAILKVTFIKWHELFHLAYFDYDIGIVGVESPIRFNDYVSPVCLPFSNRARSSFQKEKVISLGWGRTREIFDSDGSSSLPKSIKYSNVLNKIEGIIDVDKTCNSRHTNYHVDHQMCVIYLNKTACKGDSGGPLLWKDPKTGLLKLLGTHVSALKCGYDVPRNISNIESKIISYLDWIEENLRMMNSENNLSVES